MTSNLPSSVPRHGWPVFFYGLFIDVELLRAKGLEPREVRRAIVPGVSIRIGQRATLVEHSDAVAHGVVLRLRADELERLYSEPSLTAYRAMPVLAALDTGEHVPALAYVLPTPPDASEENADYTAKLREIRARLGFPPLS